jgi:hypothetical protein
MLIIRSLSITVAPFEPARLSPLGFFRSSNVGNALEPCRITLVVGGAIQKQIKTRSKFSSQNDYSSRTEC